MVKEENWKCILGFCHILAVVTVATSPITLIIVGITMAKPYMQTRHFTQVTSTCTVTSVRARGMVTCDCRIAEHNPCESVQPCAEIIVDYVSHLNESRVENATLYTSPYEYGEYKEMQCSTSACNEDVAENNRTVAAFVRKYGVIGRTFPCYPGKDSDPEALLSIIEHWKVLLGMLLPAAIFIAAGVTEICYCMVCPIYKSRHR